MSRHVNDDSTKGDHACTAHTCLAALCGGAAVVPLLTGSDTPSRVCNISKLAEQLDKRAAGAARLIGELKAFRAARSMYFDGMPCSMGKDQDSDTNAAEISVQVMPRHQQTTLAPCLGQQVDRFNRAMCLMLLVDSTLGRQHVVGRCRADSFEAPRDSVRALATIGCFD